MTTNQQKSLHPSANRSSSTSNTIPLDVKIQNFLDNDDRLSVISFRALGMIINKQSFKRVAEAIAKRHIRVQQHRLAVPGQYWIAENIIAIDGDSASRGGLDFDSIVLHECIHAYQDILAQPRPVSESEYVAYVAQAIFAVNSGKQFGQTQEDHYNSFAACVARLYKGDKVRYTEAELFSEFVKSMLSKVRDKHGAAIYDVGGTAPYDGVATAQPIDANSRPAAPPTKRKPAQWIPPTNPKQQRGS
jgi:hypothetical protein